jgi:shikimate kinase
MGRQVDGWGDGGQESMQHAESDRPGDAPVVVVGLMGSGKSTLGAALADALDRTLQDSDRDIGRSAGSPTGSIAAEMGGVERLHELEAEHVLRCLDERDSVIAAAASVIERPDVRRRMRSAIVIWLDADAALLAGRIRQVEGRDRPDLGDPLVVLAEQDRRRRALFTDVADVVIDAGLTPDRVAERAKAALAERGLRI